MGCVSSSSLKAQMISDLPAPRKGISLPSHLPANFSDDFHIVALTSSTYGILKVDSPKPPEEDKKQLPVGGESVKDVLNRFGNLDSGADAAPQSWLEVSSMLENLKPGLEKTESRPKMLGKFGSQQPDAIDIREIMDGLVDEDNYVAPVASQTKTAPSAPRKIKPFDKSLPIRTLEELDSCLGGKTNAKSPSKDASLPVSSTTNLTSRSSSPMQDSTNKASSKAVKNVENGPTRKGDSSLFDADFLGSYEKALANLSNDEWNALEAQEQVELNSQEDVGAQLDGDLCAVPQEPVKQVAPKSDAKVSEKLFPQEVQIQSEATPSKAAFSKIKSDPFKNFEKICPPGGEKSVVFYTTSLRGIRKTYEDCNKIRGMVQCFGIPIDERDVSMHLEFRNELRDLMGRVVTIPRLFIKGSYIGGVEEVSRLHEEGKLAELLNGFPREANTGGLCDGCAGARFVPCFDCSGSCKAVNEQGAVIRCPDCNENGLIQCPICS